MNFFILLVLHRLRVNDRLRLFLMLLTSYLVNSLFIVSLSLEHLI